MKETKAAGGYILDETSYEVVLKYDGDAPEVVVYTLELTNEKPEPEIPKEPEEPEIPKLPQTGDDFNPWLYGGIGAAAMLAGILLLLLKKKQK